MGGLKVLWGGADSLFRVHGDVGGMTEDRTALLLAAAGLCAVFASLAVPHPGLLVLAYPLLGVATWLLVREHASSWVGALGAGALGVLILGVLATHEFALGFQGNKVLDLSTGLGGPAWAATLTLAPLAVLCAGLAVRARGWGRASAVVGLGLVGITLLLTTRSIPGITVGDQVPGFGVVPVLVAVAVGLTWLAGHGPLSGTHPPVHLR